MIGGLPQRIILTLLLLPGCGDDVTLLPSAAKAELRELTPIEFGTLEFVHDSLRARLQRIDTLARRLGLPEANTIGWSRRPPNANDGRRLPSYVAQWSTHSMRFGEAIQPHQRPGQRISVIADVSPENSPKLWRLHLSADRRSEKEAWNASILLFSVRPYQRNRMGEEELKILLEQPDSKGHVSWPFSASAADLVTERPDGTIVEMRPVRLEPSFRRMRSMFASPDTFLNEMRQQLAEFQRDVLADIKAGRRLRLGEYVNTTSIPDPTRREFREFEVPEGFRLTAEERQVFTAKVTAWVQSQRTLLEEDYEEMYAAILRAFPIDEYFAAESEADKAVTNPRD